MQEQGCTEALPGVGRLLSALLGALDPPLRNEVLHNIVELRLSAASDGQDACCRRSSLPCCCQVKVISEESPDRAAVAAKQPRVP